VRERHRGTLEVHLAHSLPSKEENSILNPVGSDSPARTSDGHKDAE